MFFSEYDYFQICSPGWRFLKIEMYRIRVDGRKRRFPNTMTSCPGSRIAFPHIRFENVTCGRSFFLMRRKKAPFSKIPGYVWTVKYDLKTLRVDADFFFLNTEKKKSRFRKYLATCGRGLKAHISVCLSFPLLFKFLILVIMLISQA